MTAGQSVLEQDRAYKRGVVLGLTLAEVILLLIFCLLLMLIIPLADQDRADQKQQNLPQVEKGLDSIDKTLAEVTKVLEEGAKTKTVDELWHVLEWVKSNLKNHKKSIENVRNQLKELREKNKNLSAEKITLEQLLANLKKERELAKSKNGKGHTWPPIIRLSEADGHFFKAGDSTLTAGFERTLRDQVVAKVIEYVKKYNVDVIEVVGHTDEQPVQGRVSNLDATLLPFLNQNSFNGRVSISDNAGLGMARAASVVRLLRNDPRLSGYRILPLSAAQAVDVTGVLADGKRSGDVLERRRIEIRLRRTE